MRTLFILLLIALLPGCSTHSTPKEQVSVTPDKEQSIVFAGKVIRVEIEGGFFGLEDEQGRHYMPDRIPEALLKDGQKVRVKARPAPPAVSYRMWGRRIIVEEISAR